MECSALFARLYAGPLPVTEGEELLGTANNLKVQIHKLRRAGWQIETVRQRDRADGRRGKGFYVLRTSEADAA